MTDIIPVSLRPSDVDLTTCTTPEQALRLLLWLKDVARDMGQQIVDRGKHDQHWVLKVRAAMRATNNLAHRAVEKLDGFKGDFSLAEATLDVVMNNLQPDVLAVVLSEIEKKYPHLAVVISAFDKIDE
jgi:hypothetical protein